MTLELGDEPHDATQAAVLAFWQSRRKQRSNLEDDGKSGGEARSGAHMKGVRDLVANIFIEAGMPSESIIKEPYLPGYYRARKRWDLAVRHKDSLVAALEFKSQVGSVAKNINNRFEEALGTSTDTWVAQRKNAVFGEVPPWLGYVFVLEETAETEKPGRDLHNAEFPVDETFKGMSPNQRYQEMISRFVGDNVYQAGWFITTQSHQDGSVTYAEPLSTATGKSFRVAIQGRINLVRSMLD
ncbi:PaeR7I family type II restriction endonuclease [Micromonospora orduensis]|uniref:PaeR7I family type II restriction endonuclease n=1 Tax=Micromonospora orduensis TaxID=1420891 RepID=UPI00142ED442|nr:PaeR7I family type II restriction endonuclease [Micromonospora orduensis]